MEYYLIENKLTGEPDSYIARTTNLDIVDYDNVIDIVTRRGLTLTDTEVRSAVSELVHVICEELSKGNVVITPFARYSPSISGPFKGKSDTFDTDRHELKLNCAAGKAIEINKSKIKLVKIKHVAAIPTIDSFLNYATRENDVITPGGTVEINGELLKIDTEDNEQGIFLNQNGNSTKISAIIHNLPSKLVFNTPTNLAQGEYQLEIRCKIKNSPTIKTGIYIPSLLVL